MFVDSICAVIPAAGRGSRLGLEVPKLLAPICAGQTVWTVLRSKLLKVAGTIHLVVAPSWEAACSNLLAGDDQSERLSLSVQNGPRGMGDAIFGAYPYWCESERILVVWGDQVHVSSDTLETLVRMHDSRAGVCCTIPTVRLEQPYVQYCFEGDQLLEIRESREGARCDPQGLSDVGTFLLDNAGLYEAWLEYSKVMTGGRITGEANFLPFLPYLARSGWRVGRTEVHDPVEARGINTREDFQFFRNLYGRQHPPASPGPEERHKKAATHE